MTKIHPFQYSIWSVRRGRRDRSVGEVGGQPKSGRFHTRQVGSPTGVSLLVPLTRASDTGAAGTLALYALGSFGLPAQDPLDLVAFFFGADFGAAARTTGVFAGRLPARVLRVAGGILQTVT